MFCPKEVWPKVYSAIPEYMKGSQPHTAKLETLDVIEGYLKRINSAFEVLRKQIEDYKPDAIIVVGDDQEDMFSLANNPAIAVYTGDSVWGSSLPAYIDLPPEASRITIPVHQQLANVLIKGLVKRGFDPAKCDSMDVRGNHPERGASDMIVYPWPKLVPKLNIPVIPVFLNAYYPPQPTGLRCWELGEAIADTFKDRPERIAIYGSGGMSHDPFGPRAGWIDEPLDRWVFERIESGRSDELANLFSFDSAAMHGGTGELRAWITAAAACPWPGKKVEYIPAHHAKTGLGFCYWPAQN
jgi:protocatechuate 4,5-dioxygenase beta chain